VAIKEDLARALILADCADDQTLLRPVRDPAGEIVLRDGEPVTEKVELAAAGLKITQKETFFVEANSEDAATLKPEPVA
jgi:hypothetical protein